MATNLTKADVNNYILPILLALITFCAYFSLLDNNFVSIDDYTYVRDNPNIQSGVGLESIRWAFGTIYASNWFPLTWLSHALDIQLFGLNPHLHHLTSLLLHIVNTLLLFFLVRRMTGLSGRSFAVALLFGLHPMHVESVAWLAERKDLLSTMFMLLAIRAYIGYSQQPGIPRYLLVFAIFACGLMAKPMLVTLPIILMLLDFWPLGRFQQDPGSKRFNYRWLFLEKIPLVLLSLASTAVTIVAQKDSIALNNQQTHNLLFDISNAVSGYVTYLGKLLWPRSLAIFYPLHNVTLIGLTCAVIILAGITMLLFRIKRGPLLFGWGWYLLTLLPVIGIIRIGEQSIADRYTYIPAIGLFIMVVWAGAELIENRPWVRNLATCLSLASVIGMIMMTRQQVTFWQDNIALYSHAIEVTDDNWLARANLAVAQFYDGRLEAAEANARESLRISPRSRTWYFLGDLLARKGDSYLTQAIAAYREALRLDRFNIMARFRLADALSMTGKQEAAIDEYKRLRDYDPQKAEQILTLILHRSNRH